MVTGGCSDSKAGSMVQLEAGVFGAAVQLPTFDRTEPDAWFALADANFGLQKITDSQTKYWYVLSKFDTTMLKKLSTFLKMPTGSDPYQELRAKLCQTFEPPLEQKLDAFLALTDIGDERPVEFGMEIQRLMANATTDYDETRFLALSARVYRHSDKQQPVRQIRVGHAGSRQGLAMASGWASVFAGKVGETLPGKPKEMPWSVDRSGE